MGPRCPLMSNEVKKSTRETVFVGRGVCHTGAGDQGAGASDPVESFVPPLATNCGCEVCESIWMVDPG